MSAISTDLYGPDLTGDFEAVPVEELQGGDIIPSHDGLYHEYEGHVENDNGTVTVNFTRSVRADGRGDRYSVEFPAGHMIRVLS